MKVEILNLRLLIYLYNTLGLSVSMYVCPCVSGPLAAGESGDRNLDHRQRESRPLAAGGAEPGRPKAACCERERCELPRGVSRVLSP